MVAANGVWVSGGPGAIGYSYRRLSNPLGEATAGVNGGLPDPWTC